MRIALLVIVLAGCDIYDPRIQPVTLCADIIAGSSCPETGATCDVPQGVDGGSYDKCACDSNRWTCTRVLPDAGVN